VLCGVYESGLSGLFSLPRLALESGEMREGLTGFESRVKVPLFESGEHDGNVPECTHESSVQPSNVEEHQDLESTAVGQRFQKICWLGRLVYPGAWHTHGFGLKITLGNKRKLTGRPRGDGEASALPFIAPCKLYRRG